MGYYMAGGAVSDAWQQLASGSSSVWMQGLKDTPKSNPIPGAIQKPSSRASNATPPSDATGAPHRRKNYANPRAARRSMRRIAAFAKMAHRMMSFPRHHAKAHPFPHRKRRK
jgi:hypothetical protein